MNRKDEYINLLNELDSTPPELEYTLVKAEARLKSKNRHGFFTLSLSSLATFLIVFTILVNYSTTFVYAVGRIPLIKELAHLVAFSPSLSAAIENEYVQPMKLEQAQDGITARVEYVIVDQKQLDIFYSLDSKAYSAMRGTPEIKESSGRDLEGYGLSSGSNNVPNGELRHISVDFVDRDMPSGIKLILKVDDFDKVLDEEARHVTEDFLLEDNNKYEFNSMSSTSNDERPERFEVRFALQDYPYNTVYLSPAYSRVVDLARSINIKIK